MKTFIKDLIKFIFNFKEQEKLLGLKKGEEPTFKQSLAWHTARGFRNTSIFALFLATGWVSAVVYNYLNPRVEAQTVVQTVIVESTTTPPVLQRIMVCESKKKHIAKNGQITYNINTDGTLDLGIMEINTVNFAQASKLGYDLTKESDNIAFGKWLYANQGTEPWASSRQCWSR